jgi:hypothetical protein
MATGSQKRIHEYHYCHKTEREKNFAGYIWPTIRRNYRFYSLIDNPLTFQAQDTLYSFKDTTKECATLRRNDYLLKLANAMVYFGEKYIIENLNGYYEQNINELATAAQSNYSAPKFKQWTDVTDYIGNRFNPGIPARKREKRQSVYNQMCVIAEQRGIPSQHWSFLMSLYHERNRMCHQMPNIADTESMREYANLTDNQKERDSVRILSDLVIGALQTRRRAWR